MTSSAGLAVHRLEIEVAANDYEVWVVMRGDADAATLRHLDAALARIVLDGQPTVCVDLSNLDFMDVASLRRLITFAEHVRRSGRHVVTVGASPLLHTVADVLPGRDQLGLV